MAKPKKTPPKTPVAAKPAEKSAEKKAPAVQSHAFRETVESIVIAFVLAFLFRVFEAEAFVIPTGSMAPTLMGRHKDVDCPQCGYRYQVSASEENPPDDGTQRGGPSVCVAGQCPVCKYVMPMVGADKLPAGVPELGRGPIEDQRSYNGDRILVNKYIYTFTDPKRWDVVVFKFPGDAKVNYITRLVGLPGETLRIFQGDLFVGPEKASQPADFEIERKPADKVLAMRQLVHDTDHDPTKLAAAGWPLRWQPLGDDSANGWKVESNAEGTTVRQKFRVDVADDGPAWLRYHHFVPQYETWQKVLNSDAGTKLPESMLPGDRLITDANPYNGREDYFHLGYGGRLVADRNTLEIDRYRQGLHWVGDLMVEADVNVEEARGELLLDLVEGGRHFTATIDLKTGEAKLAADGDDSFKPTAKTSITSPGKYRLAFANVDDQLHLWIDGGLVAFDGPTTYDVDKIFGDRASILPATSDVDPGDLAPAGIGARGAKVEVDRLQLWRDIYYIADSVDLNASYPVSDFENLTADFLLDLPTRPDLWNHFAERREARFPLGADQFFVMGDNSAESSDARLWSKSRDLKTGQALGQYLERNLLIGKALVVYWPHSWNRIPGTPIPFPLFPNFEDMRLVR
jgi:signal peptidase I